jgi:hypothetical protein
VRVILLPLTFLQRTGGVATRPRNRPNSPVKLTDRSCAFTLHFIVPAVRGTAVALDEHGKAGPTVVDPASNGASRRRS